MVAGFRRRPQSRMITTSSAGYLVDYMLKTKKHWTKGLDEVTGLLFLVNSSTNLNATYSHQLFWRLLGSETLSCQERSVLTEELCPAGRHGWGWWRTPQDGLAKREKELKHTFLLDPGFVHRIMSRSRQMDWLVSLLVSNEAAITVAPGKAESLLAKATVKRAKIKGNPADEDVLNNYRAKAQKYRLQRKRYILDYMIKCLADCCPPPELG